MKQHFMDIRVKPNGKDEYETVLKNHGIPLETFPDVCGGVLGSLFKYLRKYSGSVSPEAIGKIASSFWAATMQAEIYAMQESMYAGMSEAEKQRCAQSFTDSASHICDTLEAAENTDSFFASMGHKKPTFH